MARQIEGQLDIFGGVYAVPEQPAPKKITPKVRYWYTASLWGRYHGEGPTEKAARWAMIEDAKRHNVANTGWMWNSMLVEIVKIQK